MNLDIVPAEACDAVAIARVVNAAYRVEDFFKVGDRTDAREVAEFLLHETFLVARDEDDAIVGAVRVSTDGERGHFGMLSVDPSAQGTGLAPVMSSSKRVTSAASRTPGRPRINPPNSSNARAASLDSVTTTSVS